MANLLGSARLEASSLQVVADRLAYPSWRKSCSLHCTQSVTVQGCIALHQLPQIPAGLNSPSRWFFLRKQRSSGSACRVVARAVYEFACDGSRYMLEQLRKGSQVAPNLTDETTEVGRARDLRPAGSSRQLEGQIPARHETRRYRAASESLIHFHDARVTLLERPKLRKDLDSTHI